MNKFNELIAKLREILQIDRPDLDFGIYRIINVRAAEIEKFLTVSLPKKIRQSLTAGGETDVAELQAELEKTIATARELGADPENLPKVKELRQRIAEASAGTVDYESRVYAHLLQFFSRYYDKGDFISKRRYKGDTYAIPYAGEEVKLYWANFDQYYTKSGENFSNYTLKLADDKRVHFRLVSADTAKDNRKDNELERCFVLFQHRDTETQSSGAVDAEERNLLPDDFIEVNGDDLTIYFEYKPMPKGTKQAELIQQAVKSITEKLNPIISSASAPLRLCVNELLSSCPTPKNPERTRLEKALTDYVSKNTADYFIHKDLGKFLSRELDFYIKNEMMNLDDIQHIKAFKEIEKNLKMIQCMRLIAGELITFMAQLEDFQKKLWLKKKFIVETNYCITLDRVPEVLRKAAFENKAQVEEWERLGILNTETQRHGDEPDLFNNPSVPPYLRVENSFLMVDTKFFNADFKAKLLASLGNIDEECGGLLIHSENFQALNLLQERYKEQVKCIYIDPPYNTNATEITYKNNYKHSSWLSLIADRVLSSKLFLTNSGVVAIAIDDYEHVKMQNMLDQTMGFENRLGNIVVVHNPGGRHDDKFIATAHEYCLYYGNNIEHTYTNLLPLEESDIDSFNKQDDNGAFRTREFRRSGNNSTREARPKMYYPLLFKDNTLFIIEEDEYEKIFDKNKNCFNDYFLEQLRNKYDALGYDFILPIDPKDIKRVWRWGYDTLKEKIKDIFAENNRGKVIVKTKDRLENKQGLKPKSVWYKAKYTAATGTTLVKDLCGDGLFSYPKSLNTVVDSIRIGANEKSIVLDYFAGSGTTGHAVINLNREDDGKRKYILVEMGDHFNNVLKPRIEKVVYSPDWKDGKPTTFDKGIYHCFKYLRLESYEDTLNNLELKREKVQDDMLAEMPESLRSEYLLKYMLDIECRGSILSTNAFKKPFDYALNIAADSAGATTRQSIDLVETFNYLIGLRLKTYNYRPERGIAIIEGTLPGGESTLILWRDCDKVGYEELNKYCESLNINPKSSHYDVVYVNGDHGIANQTQSLESEGGITKLLKLRQIEEEFLTRMFMEE